MKNTLLAASLILGGCTIGNGHVCGPQTPQAYCDKEAYEALLHPAPYGAHWVKSEMTRDERQQVLLQCGGGYNLSDGYKDWLSSVPHEVYAQGRVKHYQSISRCMRDKGYVYLDKCDARCMYP